MKIATDTAKVNQNSLDEEQAAQIYENAFPIVAIGGGGGSLMAFEEFFKHMPIDSGIAFVIIIQQDVNEKEVRRKLQSYTTMPVLMIEDGIKLAINTLYLLPKTKDVGIHIGHLLLFDTTDKKNAKMPIDYFFQRLAEDQWNLAVGIVFSGLGADGETGVRMIKEKLGMVMVQEPETAINSNMPNAAISTQMADYVLAPEEMPNKLLHYLNHPFLNNYPSDEENGKNYNAVHIQKILMLLRSHIGHDFTLYKKNTISRRIERRIAFSQLPDYESYVNFLRENPKELELLFNELLIGVTKFFRDKKAFKILEENLFKLLQKKDPQDPIRVWVAGCSTGEEAYSIAILITEFMDTLSLKRKPRVQIFATDLDSRAIDAARNGFYLSNISSELSAKQLERFFDKKNNGYNVKKEVREMIVFAQHNLIKDAPFTRLDLLCCRNVMIYLSVELQKKIIPIFHYSLNIGGLLFLGPAESVGTFREFFIDLDSKWKLFERKDGISSLGKLLDFPFNIANQNKLGKTDLVSKLGNKNLIAEHFNRILLTNHTPPSFLLNNLGEILYINGNTGNFIQLQTGEAEMNIHKMIREELKYALGNAIHQAYATKTKIEVKGIKLKNQQKNYLVKFEVDYLFEPPLNGMLLVSFFESVVAKQQIKKTTDTASTAIAEDLEKELIYTKQQLHTTIEQMETSLEELKSTNEELQSTNEEHQSTNEEALTTKEEMQSLNEELMTINLQYQNKAEELTQLNNDMKNLLDNIEIGTIFLDTDLNILRFTPQVTKLFNVIAGDIGRSITHIVSNFEYPSIDLAITKVIETLVGKEIEVKTKENDWYNLRIMPYRTLDNFISGAVLTFTKITPIKSMSEQIKGLLAFTQSIISESAEATIVLDSDKKVIVFNDAFLKFFKVIDADLTEQSFLEIVSNKWHLTDLFDRMQGKRIATQEFYVEHNFSGIGELKLNISIKHIAAEVEEFGLLILKFKKVL